MVVLSICTRAFPRHLANSYANLDLAVQLSFLLPFGGCGYEAFSAQAHPKQALHDTS